jgi:hypothetical protein
MSGGALSNCEGCEEMRKTVAEVKRLVLVLEQESINLREIIAQFEKRVGSDAR